MYDSIDFNGALVDEYLNAIEGARRTAASYLVHNQIHSSTTSISQNKRALSFNERFIETTDIVNKLKQRLKALRAANINQKDKTRLISSTQSSIQAFSNQYVSKYIAITDLLGQLGPQILSDYEHLLEGIRGNETVDAKEWQYQMHDNISIYEDILDSISLTLGAQSDGTDPTQEYIDQANSLSLDNAQQITKDDINNLREDIAVIKDGISKCKTALTQLHK